MGATYRKKNKRSWVVTVHAGGQREFKVVRSKQDAEELVREIHKRELAGINVLEAIRRARAERIAPPPVTPTYPRLRDALPDWLHRQEHQREIRASTARIYRSRLAVWVYPHELADGRCLGDLPINEVTREMLGGVIRRVREAGRSLAIIDGIRNPLRSYYAELIEAKTLPGPNPAADLKPFIGRGVYRRAKSSPLAFFSQEEGPQLVATARALFPRWHAFILTGLLAGLRWGESAALYKTDIDWTRGRLHVQRTFSSKGNRVEQCKDHDDRWVKASPALLAALRDHVDAIDLEGQVKGWTPEQRQLVFPNTVGRTVRHGHFVESVWELLLAKAGLPYRKYHATRHTYATWLIGDGADLQWVQGQMGHASIQQTSDTYAHCQPERHETAVAGLDRYLKV